MYMNVKSIQKITIIFTRERKGNRKRMFEKNERIFLQLSIFDCKTERFSMTWLTVKKIYRVKYS